MAQALERAGDHVKNLAEEICHLTSGRTLRHVVSAPENKPSAQMYLQTLHQPRSGAAEPANQDGGTTH
jgi:phosphate uptake regulator